MKSEPKGTIDPVQGELFEDPYFPGYFYRWQWITNFSLNTDGYSRYWSGGTDCATAFSGSTTQVRSLSSIDDISSRLAVAPIRYAGLDIGWMRFYGYDAAWPTMDRYATNWSWYQLIWDTRREYGNRFYGAFADGHAGKYGKEKFVAYYADTPSQNEANNTTEFCAAMERNDRWKFWGKPWQGD